MLRQHPYDLTSAAAAAGPAGPGWQCLYGPCGWALLSWGMYVFGAGGGRGLGALDDVCASAAAQGRCQLPSFVRVDGTRALSQLLQLLLSLKRQQ